MVCIADTFLQKSEQILANSRGGQSTEVVKFYNWCRRPLIRFIESFTAPLCWYMQMGSSGWGQHTSHRDSTVDTIVKGEGCSEVCYAIKFQIRNVHNAIVYQSKRITPLVSQVNYFQRSSYFQQNTFGINVLFIHNKLE